MDIYPKNDSTVLPTFKNSSLFDDSVFFVGNICRIFEFWDLFTELVICKADYSILTVLTKQNIDNIYIIQK